MSKEFVDTGLETTFEFCSGLNPIEGARQLIRLVQKLGGGFLKIGGREAETNPFAEIDAKGDINITLIEHSLLQPDTLTYWKRGKGSASLSFGRESMFVTLGQDISFPDPSKADPVAHGQLAFARLLYPHLRPKYGWIDESSGNEPTSKDIAATKLQYIFWANFFGPEYVERYGRDFLLNAPGWKVEELDDGGILYVTLESFVEWWRTERLDILRYFRTQVPDIRLYRAEVELD